ncbi:MAG: hypothetical protein R3330_03860 [Saprospiraceae bacterium]|nr:hypothetical protein [Saprospiraceae bacterium]
MQPVKTLLLLLSLVLVSSCGYKFGKNLGTGLSEGVSTNASDIGRNVIGGVNQGLAEDSLKNELKDLVTEVLAAVDASLNEQLLPNLNIDTVTNKLYYSLIGYLENDTLQQALNGVFNSVGSNLETLISRVIGSATSRANQQQINAFIAGIINEDLGNKLQASLTGILDSVLTRQGALDLTANILNDSLTVGLQTLVDSLLMTVARRIPEITEGAKEPLSFFKKQAEELLILIALLALGIIAYIWNQRRKAQKVARVLAHQINDIPDEKTFNELTTRIQQEAISVNAEKDLRKMLSDNGMLGKEAWLSKKQKAESAQSLTSGS